MAEKVWVSRVLDYVAGAQVLCRTDLPYSLALATIILHDSLEIAIRCWLRYDQRIHLGELEQKYANFQDLLTALRQNHSQLSPNVLTNLKCLQDRRNALTHDIRGASISNREFATIQSSVLSALEALIGAPIAVDLLLPPIARSASVGQKEGAGYAASARLRDALRLYYSGKTNDAQGIAMALVCDDPGSASAHHLIGLCLKRQDEFEGAFAALDTARNCPGGTEDIVLMLDFADVALSIGKVECSEAAALCALNLNATGSDRSRAYAILGDCNISTHDFSLAERYFREALTHDNTYQRHLRGLLKALQSQQKFDEVIDLASQAIKTASRNGYYYLDRALALWKRNRADDRNAAVNRDLKAAEDRFHGKNAVTRLYFSWFLVEESVELQTKGHLLEAKRKLECATNFLKQGIALSVPSFRPVLRNQLSLVYMYLGEPSAATRETAEGLRENPKYVTNYLAHARALTFAGKFADAYRTALKSQSVAPMPAGQFWSKFFAALNDFLAATNLLDWQRTRQELIDLSLRAKINSDSYQFGPMWHKIKTLNLNDDTRSRISELMRIANISGGPILSHGAVA